MAENNEEEYLDELLNSFRNSNTDDHEDEADETDEETKNSEDELLTDEEQQNPYIFDMEDMEVPHQDADMADDFVLTDDVPGDVLGDEPAEDIMDMPVLEENTEEEVSTNGRDEEDAGQDEIANIFALEDNEEPNDYNEEVLKNEDYGEEVSEPEPELSKDSYMEQNDTPELEEFEAQPDDTAQDVGLMDLLNELSGGSKGNGNTPGVNADEAIAPSGDDKKAGGKSKGLFGRKKAAVTEGIAEEAQDKASAGKKDKEEEKARKKAEKQARKQEKKQQRQEKKQQKADKKKAKGKAGNSDNSEEAEPLTETEAALQDNMDLINALYDEPEVQEVSLDDAEALADIPEVEKKEKKPKKEKKKKAPKPPKKKKPKKEKREPKPSELIKVTPFTFLGIIIFTAAFTAVVMVATKLVSYNSSLSDAKAYFENGKYEQAFDSIAGLELKDKDLDTYNKIRAVMSIYVDYSSYVNYRKVGMMVAALDSLINGLEHYDKYLADAEKYEVLTQYDGVREMIVSALAEYGISVEDALYYGELENEEQYIEILQNIGGIQQ